MLKPANDIKFVKLEYLRIAVILSLSNAWPNLWCKLLSMDQERNMGQISVMMSELSLA